MRKSYVRLDKENAAVLLVDHQAGLLSLVRDIEPDKFKNNVLALADLAKYFNLPTILTTSFEDGPNGPLVPELKESFPDAPYIARPGQINAWDNEEFVKAVKATGKKQLIIAGVVTEVCVTFPNHDFVKKALEDGRLSGRIEKSDSGGEILILSSDSSEIGAFIRESSKEKLFPESPTDVLRRIR